MTASGGDGDDDDYGEGDYDYGMSRVLQEMVGNETCLHHFKVLINFIIQVCLQFFVKDPKFVSFWRLKKI